MINDYTHERHIEIGKIDILDTFSYVDVEESKAQAVIDAFEDKFVKGRPISVEIAESKGSSPSRGRSSERRSSSDGRRRDGGGERRSSSNKSNDRRSNDRNSSDRRSSDRKKDSSRRDSDRKRYR